MDKHYLLRILSDRSKILCFSSIFLLTFFYLVSRIIYIPYGMEPMHPSFNSFLSLTGLSMYPAAIFFWFLPVYLLYLFSDDIFEDYSNGYYLIISQKVGFRYYALSKIKKSFFYSFLFIIALLFINLLFSYILFSGATYSSFYELTSYFDKRHLLSISLAHPFLANICFSLATAFLAGILGLLGASLALLIKKRNVVFPIILCLWFIPVCSRKSIMLSLQPFSEYDLDYIYPTYLITIIVSILISWICCSWELKRNANVSN